MSDLGVLRKQPSLWRGVVEGPPQQLACCNHPSMYFFIFYNRGFFFAIEVLLHIYLFLQQGSCCRNFSQQWSCCIIYLFIFCNKGLVAASFRNKGLVAEILDIDCKNPFATRVMLQNFLQQSSCWRTFLQIQTMT